MCSGMRQCLMQAALLEPELKADGQAETGEEEELVDFDADEVMDEPVKPQIKVSFLSVLHSHDLLLLDLTMVCGNWFDREL